MQMYALMQILKYNLVTLKLNITTDLSLCFVIKYIASKAPPIFQLQGKELSLNFFRKMALRFHV